MSEQPQQPEQPEPQPSSGTGARPGRLSSADRRTVVVGVTIVALSVAMLLLAGSSTRGIGVPTGVVSRVALDQRTFVCDAYLPGTRVQRGSVVGGPGKAMAAAGPTVVAVDQQVARGAYAVEQATGARWFASQPCPEARSQWWFAAAGGSSAIHDTVLTVTNPRDGAAVLDIDVYGPKGPVAAPGLHGLTLAGQATTRLDISHLAPAVGDLAVSVVATRGLVAASAIDSFSPGAVGKPLREWLPASNLPATQFTLAGVPARPSIATVVVANPNQVEAVVGLAVVGNRGTFTPRGVPPATMIGPGQVAAIPVAGIFNGTPVNLRVTSTVPITATLRAIQNGDLGFASAATPLRGVTAVAVPSGSSRQLILSSVGAAGRVLLTEYDSRGRKVVDRTVAVPAGTSVAVVLTRTVATVRIASADGTVVAGYVVTGPHQYAAGVAVSSTGSIRLPAIRSAY